MLAVEGVALVDVGIHPDCLAKPSAYNPPGGIGPMSVGSLLELYRRHSHKTTRHLTKLPIYKFFYSSVQIFSKIIR